MGAIFDWIANPAAQIAKAVNPDVAKQFDVVSNPIGAGAKAIDPDRGRAVAAIFNPQETLDLGRKAHKDMEEQGLAQTAKIKAGLAVPDAPTPDDPVVATAMGDAARTVRRRSSGRASTYLLNRSSAGLLDNPGNFFKSTLGG